MNEFTNYQARCSRGCSTITSVAAQCEKPLKKWHLEFASPSGDYSTFLCHLLSFLIVYPLILQNTFWSYKILVTFNTIFDLGLPAKASLLLKNVLSSTGNKILSLVYTRLE